MINDLIPNVIEAIVGSSVSFSFETLSQALVDKNKSKGVSSVVPAPKFTLLSRVKSGSREIFLELKEVSGNRVASMCLVEAKDIKFKKAFEGYSYIPKIEPNETSSEFLLGTVSSSEISDNTPIGISVVLTNADLNEKGSIHQIFSGTLMELIVETEHADHSSNDLDINITGYSISDSEAIGIAESYINNERSKILNQSQYDMVMWDRDCSKIDKKMIAAWVISKDLPKNDFVIKNRSKSRFYSNLEIEITSECSLVLVPPTAKDEILPKPKLLSKYNNHHLSALMEAASLQSYFPPFNQDEEIYVEDGKVIITIKKLRAFKNIDVNSEEYRLIFFCPDDEVKCELIARDDENIKYLAKEILISSQKVSLMP